MVPGEGEIAAIPDGMPTWMAGSIRDGISGKSGRRLS
jgi:hypothetical protein